MRTKFIFLLLSTFLFVLANIASSASQKPMTAADLALYKGANRQQLLEEDQAFFVLLDLGRVGNHFLGEELLGGAADQPLVVVEIGRGEDFPRLYRADQERSAANHHLLRRCRRHVGLPLQRNPRPIRAVP